VFKLEIVHVSSVLFVSVCVSVVPTKFPVGCWTVSSIAVVLRPVNTEPEVKVVFPVPPEFTGKGALNELMTFPDVNVELSIVLFVKVCVSDTPTKSPVGAGLVVSMGFAPFPTRTFPAVKDVLPVPPNGTVKSVVTGDTLELFGLVSTTATATTTAITTTGITTLIAIIAAFVNAIIQKKKNYGMVH
jgi:hypothetical protein